MTIYQKDTFLFKRGGKDGYLPRYIEMYTGYPVYIYFLPCPVSFFILEYKMRL